GAANHIIENNRDQLQKTVWTQNIDGNLITVSRNLTDNEEGMMVARSIFETKMNEQAKDDEFAVLYRTNAQSRSMEEALRKMNIPYRIYGGQSFYQRKEIKDLIAYFRLVINPRDEEALKRVINYPARGIGKTTLEKAIVLANDWNQDIWSVISDPQTIQSQFNAGTVSKLNVFSTMIKSFQAELKTIDAYELGSKIATSTGLVKNLYEDKSPEGVSRYENIQELLNGLKEFVEDRPGEDEVVDETELKTLDQFAADIALLTDADTKNDSENLNKVSLMTIHASKGLEFPYVHIVGLEENLFPSQLSLSSRTDLEEERRLFYVALTRAEKKVSLSYAVSRFRWGNLVHSEPSRFIEEIPEKHLNVTSSEPAVTKKPLTSPTWNRKPLTKRNEGQPATASRAQMRSKNLTKYNDSRQP
ncbi:MAG: 3'-5' exonuclease, partial [Flavobacteriales bacterium]|nr:3'-5' exonuclease [Flavobacteriales bacterium]